MIYPCSHSLLCSSHVGFQVKEWSVPVTVSTAEQGADDLHGVGAQYSRFPVDLSNIANWWVSVEQRSCFYELLCPSINR